MNLKYRNINFGGNGRIKKW